MDVYAISFLALVWIGLMALVVALCAAGARADRRERRRNGGTFSASAALRRRQT